MTYPYSVSLSSSIERFDASLKDEEVTRVVDGWNISRLRVVNLCWSLNKQLAEWTFSTQP